MVPGMHKHPPRSGCFKTVGGGAGDGRSFLKPENPPSLVRTGRGNLTAEHRMHAPRYRVVEYTRSGVEKRVCPQIMGGGSGASL